MAKQSSCCQSFDFVKPSTGLVFSNSWLTQISIVSSRGMLVKIQSKSKLPIDNWDLAHISFQLNEMSLNLYYWGFNIRTKNLARLYVGVRFGKANKVGLNGIKRATAQFLFMYFAKPTQGTWSNPNWFYKPADFFDIMLESIKLCLNQQSS